MTAARAAARPSPEDAALLDRLTEREREVLELLGEGLATPRSPPARARRGDREDPRLELLAKLHLRDRVQAVVLAHRAGLAG